jgi:hypothetical protein
MVLTTRSRWRWSARPARGAHDRPHGGALQRPRRGAGGADRGRVGQPTPTAARPCARACAPCWRRSRPSRRCGSRASSRPTSATCSCSPGRRWPTSCARSRCPPRCGCGWPTRPTAPGRCARRWTARWACAASSTSATSWAKLFDFPRAGVRNVNLARSRSCRPCAALLLNSPTRCRCRRFTAHQVCVIRLVRCHPWYTQLPFLIEAWSPASSGRLASSGLLPEVPFIDRLLSGIVAGGACRPSSRRRVWCRPCCWPSARVSRR